MRLPSVRQLVARVHEDIGRHIGEERWVKLVHGNLDIRKVCRAS